MPKNRNKKGSDDRPSAAGGKSKSSGGASGGRRSTTESSETYSDSGDEARSHVSLDEDLGSVMGDQEEEEGSDTEGGETKEEAMDSKLSEHLENATHKNSHVRLAALKGLQGLLCRCFMPDIVNKWKATLADVIEKSLRRLSLLDESRMAVKLAGLLAIQAGSESSDLVEKLVQILRVHMADPSLDAEYRGQCAVSLAVCCYLSVEEMEPLLQSLQAIHGVWSGVKAGGHSHENEITMFCLCLGAWGLLLSHMNNRQKEEHLASDLPKLCTYLEINQVDMRIATGETLALLYEIGNELNSDFRPPNHQNTLEKLELLTNDSLKFRAKKDRRVQRCSFRQIYAAISEQEQPLVKIKFSPESLELDSWASKIAYDCFCMILRGGMNAHLKTNVILREIFDLGAPLENTGKQVQMASKIERQAIQAQESKIRSQQRSKQRDKRTAKFEMD